MILSDPPLLQSVAYIPNKRLGTGQAIRQAHQIARGVRLLEVQKVRFVVVFFCVVSWTLPTISRIGIGVGTPLRLIDLLNEGKHIHLARRIPCVVNTVFLTQVGSLSFLDLRRVVVDCSHIDQKGRGILDMRETLEPLIRLLKHPDIKDRYGKGHDDVHLLFF